MIVDSSWDEEYVDNLLTPATKKPEPDSAVAEEEMCIRDSAIAACRLAMELAQE